MQNPDMIKSSKMVSLAFFTVSKSQDFQILKMNAFKIVKLSALCTFMYLHIQIHIIVNVIIFYQSSKIKPILQRLIYWLVINFFV